LGGDGGGGRVWEGFGGVLPAEGGESARERLVEFQREMRTTTTDLVWMNRSSRWMLCFSCSSWSAWPT
jgi:hypothetical protein